MRLDMIMLTTLWHFTGAQIDNYYDQARSCCDAIDMPPHCSNMCNVRDVLRQVSDQYEWETGAWVEQMMPSFRPTRTCVPYISEISKCLAQGRNNEQCCRERGEPNSETGCFAMCNANNPPILEWNNHFSSCMLTNARVIYECTQEGYLKRPTPPTNVYVSDISTNAAKISWSRSAHMPASVQSYIVSVELVSRELNERLPIGKRRHQLIVNGGRSEAFANNLYPGTTYRISVAAADSNDRALSMPSQPVIITTNGVPPKVRALSSEVNAIEGSEVILACIANRDGFPNEDTFTLRWYHNGRQIEFDSLYDAGGREDEGLNDSEKNRGTHIVMTLKITQVKTSVYGLYTCEIANGKGLDKAEIALRKISMTDIAPPSSPPNVTECCVMAGVRASCLHQCGSGSVLREADNECRNDYSQQNKIRNCLDRKEDHSACCLHAKVPLRCLDICGPTEPGQRRRSAEHYSTCALSMETFMSSCQDKGRPNVPGSLVLNSDSTMSTLSISWSPSTGATRYTVYYRIMHAPSWRQVSTSSTHAKLTNIVPGQEYEIVVLAENGSGFSYGSASLFVKTGSHPRRIMPSRWSTIINGDQSVISVMEIDGLLDRHR